MDIDEIGKIIVDSSIKVHQRLGPGLLESAYQLCLERELSKRGLFVACEVALPLVYEGETIETAYRIDMLVENRVIIENKVVEEISKVHIAHLITYLKLSNCWLGYILNWNTTRMKDGICRKVFGLKPVTG